MKKSIQLVALLGLVITLNAPLHGQEIKNPPLTSKTEKQMKQAVIDKLTIPANAKEAVVQRMNINRDIIRKQPGFIKDEIFEQSDENGNLVVITVALWENTELLSKAKEAVQTEYKRMGFNITDFTQKFHVTLERGIYAQMD